MTQPLLRYENVTVEYDTGARATRNVSLDVAPDECLALVGESGCGKTTLARAALGLLPAGARVTGSIRIAGDTQVVGATPATLRRLRGLDVGFVAQDPFEACNPLDRVETHVAEAWRAHGMRPPRGAIGKALDGLGIVQASTMMHRYPHQWSGGMLQRATIAAAAVHNPLLLIADEPTSALDAELADDILEELRRAGAAVLLISHDISVVARHADRVAVLYGGRVVEIASATAVLQNPRHPYTIALLEAIPQPGMGLPAALPGAPPNLWETGPGCAFAPRCRHARDSCYVETPPLQNGVACSVLASGGCIDLVSAPRRCAQPAPAKEMPTSCTSSAHGSIPDHIEKEFVIEARDVSKTYDRSERPVHALRRASLQVRAGEIVGIAGPSGCGKSTFLRILSTTEPPTDGQVFLDGVLVAHGESRRILNPIAHSGYIMPIFQDPVGSLDRRWPVWRTVTEPLMATHRPNRPTKQARYSLARACLEQVGLSNVEIDARPDELSIGQCQRVSIARALVAEPALIIADEPTSALDVSVSASILHLLAGTAESGRAIVIVSHDRSMLDALCHRVLHMADGVLES